jgi:hypothetical protein
VGRLTVAFTGNDTCTARDHARGAGVYEYGHTYSPSGNLTAKTVTVDSNNDGAGDDTTVIGYTYPSGTHRVTQAGPHTFGYWS